ncbi:MAG: hypothetical protein H6738_24295 [Alphaproteobacteria bacterium]|nr:hypothetical protein [Alphaproteobacteria bacterium]MCB9699930.1 hypothetical protein [Alphaproteobacteria bacterium]
MWWSWSSVALAQWVLDWSEDFDRYDLEPFSGTDGWVCDYPNDAWSTVGTGGVRSLDDFNTSNCGGLVWGTGGCNSDHLVQTGRVYGDFALEVTMTTEGGNDDGAGVVFRYQSDSEYYVVMWSRDKLPLPTNEPTGNYDNTGHEGRVYSIHNGVGRVIATMDDPTYEIGQPHGVRVTAVGNRFDVFLDVDRDGTYTGPDEHPFSFVDGDHPDPGHVGFMVWTNRTAFDDLRILVPPPPEHTGLPPLDHTGAPTGHSAAPSSPQTGDTGEPVDGTTSPVEVAPVLRWPRPGDPGCGCSSTGSRSWMIQILGLLAIRRSVRRQRT